MEGGSRMEGEKRKNKGMWIGVSAALGCEIIFGLSYIFTKRATDVATPLALLSWRFVIAFFAVNLPVLCGRFKVGLRGRKIGLLFLIATLDPVIYFVGETVGISRTTASESGAFLACIPIASLFASSMILHKRPNRNQIVGVCVTVAGVLITVFAVGLEASFSPFGYAMLCVGVISYALYCVFVEKAEEFTGFEITYVMLFAGALVFATIAVAQAVFEGRLFSLVSLPFRERSFLIAVLYQGLGSSIIAFFLSNIAIANIGVNRTASFIGVATVVSIIGGVVILGERFSALQWTGVVLIVAGVYISNSRVGKEG